MPTITQLVTVVMLACLVIMPAAALPNYTTEPVDCSDNPNTAETCDPGADGAEGGKAVIEIVSGLNCSTWSQFEEDWPTETSGPPIDFLNALSSYSSAKHGVWYQNPAGIRYTTMSSQCVYSSPGCTGRFNSPLSPAIDLVNNTGAWFSLANTCPGADMGGCFLQSCDANTTRPLPGDIKVFGISKCSMLQWSYPLPVGSNTIATLTDPAGNKYIQHAYPNATFSMPGPSSVPKGWLLGNITFKEGDKPFTVSPLHAASTCADLKNASTAGCLWVLAQDSEGYGYHRYYWAGQEPKLFPIELPYTYGPETQPQCKADCAAEQSSYTVWSISSMTAKLTQLTGNVSADGRFAVTMEEFSADIATYVGGDSNGVKDAGFAPLKRVASQIEGATKDRKVFAAIVLQGDYQVSGDELVSFVRLIDPKLEEMDGKRKFAFTAMSDKASPKLAQVFGRLKSFNLSAATVQRPSLWIVT